MKASHQQRGIWSSGVVNSLSRAQRRQWLNGRHQPIQDSRCFERSPPSLLSCPLLLILWMRFKATTLNNHLFLWHRVSSTLFPLTLWSPQVLLLTVFLSLCKEFRVPGNVFFSGNLTWYNSPCYVLPWLVVCKQEHVLKAITYCMIPT